MSEDFYNNSNKKEKSRIEKMEESLYSLTDEIKQKDRTKLRSKNFTGVEDWEGGEKSLRFEKKERPGHTSLYTVIFAISFTFFIVAGSLAGFMFLNKKPSISPDNVSISVFGPVSVVGGDILSLQVLVENKNSVSLQDADLLVEFPTGSRYPNQSDKVLERFHKTLGIIAPGEVRTETIKVILFGEERDVKDIAITTKYQMDGSSAKFTANKEYAVTLSASALAVKTELLKEVTAGQEVVLSMDIKSNSPTLLKGVLSQVEYPQGFVFKKSTPPASFGDNAWRLGDMAQGDERHIEIRGVMQGEDTEEKVFKIFAGVVKSETSLALDTVLFSSFEEITIKKPFLNVKIVVDENIDDSFGLNNKKIKETVSVLWKNNLSDKIIDGQIEVSVNGVAVDKNTVELDDGGFYRSSDNTLLWDKRMFEDLGVIPAGKSNTVSFSFEFLPFMSGNNVVFRNPEVDIGVSVKGKRISENNVPEEIHSFVTKKIKVVTIADVQFAGRSVYYVGPFSNTGPLPPKAENETTYTIIWAIQGIANDVSNATVKTVLPPYVEWKNQISPNGANIVFNPVNHEVSWNIGKIKADTGQGTIPQEIAFQIGFTPGLGQVEQIPPLIFESRFSGKDDSAGVMIERTLGSLSTMLSTDPQFNTGQSRVAR